MQLFYNPNLNPDTKAITFSKEESGHAIKVLRKQMGDLLDLTDGKGHFYTGEILTANPNKCQVAINNYEQQAPLPYRLHLAVAPTKLNDRYEWFLEKATEIGITEITPIICDHSERKVIKPERYERILQSAMKQSLKAYLPLLNAAIPLKDFLASAETIKGQKFIAHCEETERFSLKERLRPGEDVILLIGPEGDFSSEEIERALVQGFAPITLGESRLRTETAAIVAVHSVAFVNSL